MSVEHVYCGFLLVLGSILHTDKATKDCKNAGCYTYSSLCRVTEVKSFSGAGSVDKQSSQLALTYAESKGARK